MKLIHCKNYDISIILIYSQKPLYTFIENKDIILIIYFI